MSLLLFLKPHYRRPHGVKIVHAIGGKKRRRVYRIVKGNAEPVSMAAIAEEASRARTAKRAAMREEDELLTVYHLILEGVL